MSEETSKRSWEFIAIPVVAVMLGALALIMWAATAGLVMAVLFVVFGVDLIAKGLAPLTG